MQAGHRNIVFDIPMQLVGVPPSPGPDALRPVEHALRRGFSAPGGRSFLHIRAGNSRRVPRLSGVLRGRRKFFMGDQPGDGVDHNDLPAHLLGIAHSRRRSAAPFPVVDSQQGGGVFHHL